VAAAAAVSQRDFVIIDVDFRADGAEVEVDVLEGLSGTGVTGELLLAIAAAAAAQRDCKPVRPLRHCCEDSSGISRLKIGSSGGLDGLILGSSVGLDCSTIFVSGGLDGFRVCVSSGGLDRSRQSISRGFVGSTLDEGVGFEGSRSWVSGEPDTGELDSRLMVGVTKSRLCDQVEVDVSGGLVEAGRVVARRSRPCLSGGVPGVVSSATDATGNMRNRDPPSDDGLGSGLAVGEGPGLTIRRDRPGTSRGLVAVPSWGVVTTESGVGGISQVSETRRRAADSLRFSQLGPCEAGVASSGAPASGGARAAGAFRRGRCRFASHRVAMAARASVTSTFPPDPVDSDRSLTAGEVPRRESGESPRPDSPGGDSNAGAFERPFARLPRALASP